MFELKGSIVVPEAAADEERLMEVALDAGAEDIRGGDGEDWTVLTPPDAIHAVRESLEAAGHEPESVELSRLPKDTVPLSGSDARQVLRLMEMLEEHDDVQKVWANFEIPDDELERLAAEG